MQYVGFEREQFAEYGPQWGQRKSSGPHQARERKHGLSLRGEMLVGDVQTGGGHDESSVHQDSADDGSRSGVRLGAFLKECAYLWFHNMVHPVWKEHHRWRSRRSVACDRAITL